MQDSIPNALADRKAFLQGCDTKGRAVVVVHGQRHFTSTRDLQETIRFISYVLDNAIAVADPLRNEARQIICLFDLGGQPTSQCTCACSGLGNSVVCSLVPACMGCAARGLPQGAQTLVEAMILRFLASVSVNHRS